MLTRPVTGRHRKRGGPELISSTRKDLRIFAAAFAAAFLYSVLFTGLSPASADEAAEIAQELAQAASEDVNDPLEPVNRVIFDFNEIFQDVLLRPASEAYNDYVPAMVRNAIGSFLETLSTPVTLANDLLQGEADRAMGTAGRFVVNATMGLGGLFDVATELGMEGHDEDFGQTMGSWGVGEGFYLVLPLFGPSNPRDVIGKFVVDPYFDAAGEWTDNSDAAEYTRTGLNALDEYSSVTDELQQVKKTSIDYYAAIRSMYRQKRKSEISNGKEIDLPPIPDLSQQLDSYDPARLSGAADSGEISLKR